MSKTRDPHLEDYRRKRDPVRTPFVVGDVGVERLLVGELGHARGRF